MDKIVAYIGLDWGDKQHSVHLQTADGTIEHRELEQKPDVLRAWVADLQHRFSGGQIAMAIEQRKVAVMHALMLYDVFVLYPINPKALARYREVFRTRPATCACRSRCFEKRLRAHVLHKERIDFCAQRLVAAAGVGHKRCARLGGLRGRGVTDRLDSTPAIRHHDPRCPSVPAAATPRQSPVAHDRIR